jgi:hypothetical protein
MWKVRRLKYSTLLRLASKLLIFGPTKVMYALILYVWASHRFLDSQNDCQEARPARRESGVADQDRNDEQRLLRQHQQPQQDPKVTARRSQCALQTFEESLPVPRPQQRTRVLSSQESLSVSIIRVTSPPPFACSSPSVGHYDASSGSAIPLWKWLAIGRQQPNNLGALIEQQPHSPNAWA